MKKKNILRSNTHNEKNRLSEVLLELIKKNNISYSEKHLAKMLNIPYTTLRDLVGAVNTNPKVDTLIPIAKFFNVPIDQLIGITPLANVSKIEEEHKWNSTLFLNCVKFIVDILPEDEPNLPADKIFSIIKDSYIYCLSKKKGKIDKEFIKWAIEKNLDTSI